MCDCASSIAAARSALGTRECGELSPEVGIAGAVRRTGRVERAARRQRDTCVEAQARGAQRVIRTNRASGFDDVDQRQPEAPGPERRERRTDRLAVQRMGQTDLIAARRDQPVGFRVEQRVFGDQSPDLVEGERLAERQQLDRPPVIGGQSIHPLPYEVDERRTRGRTLLEPPESGRVDEGAGVNGAADQLPDVQGVSPADLGHPVECLLLHRVAERRLDERADVLVAELPELHSRRRVVLPERDDRIRARLAGADRREDERRRGGGEVKDEGRRRRVEQLRIVDTEHHRTTASPGAQLLAAASEQRDDVIGANLVGYEISDGPERYGRRAAGGLDPAHERAVALGGGLSLASQARLTHAGAGNDNYPMTTRVGTRRRDRLKFAITPDERPCARRGDSLPHVPRHMQGHGTPSVRALS